MYIDFHNKFNNADYIIAGALLTNLLIYSVKYVTFSIRERRQRKPMCNNFKFVYPIEQSMPIVESTFQQVQANLVCNNSLSPIQDYFPSNIDLHKRLDFKRKKRKYNPIFTEARPKLNKKKMLETRVNSSNLSLDSFTVSPISTFEIPKYDEITYNEINSNDIDFSNEVNEVKW